MKTGESISLTLQLPPTGTLEGPSTSTASKLRRAVSKRSGALWQGVGMVLGGNTLIWSNYGDLTRPHPKWWFSEGNPLISGKPRLVKYYNLARLMVTPMVDPVDGRNPKQPLWMYKTL